MVFPASFPVHSHLDTLANSELGGHVGRRFVEPLQVASRLHCGVLCGSCCCYLTPDARIEVQQPLLRARCPEPHPAAEIALLGSCTLCPLPTE